MQSKLMSAVEAQVNLVVGFGLSWAVNVWLVPWLFGVRMNARQGFGIVVLFSVFSFIRQFVLRRVFNRVDVVALAQRRRRRWGVGMARHVGPDGTGK